MKAALLVIGFLVLAWAVNGEFAAQRLDAAYEVDATECVSNVEQAARGATVLLMMAGHEITYTMIRNTLIKRQKNCP